MRVTPVRRALSLAGIVAAVLLLVEIAVRLINPCMGCDLRPLPPPYRGQPWAVRLFRETATHEYMRYVPFLMWAPREFSGEYVHVGTEGQRRTWNPDGLSQTADEIDIFGGLATFGGGARDEYTWPSHLSRLMNAARPAYRIVNYAVEGYNLAQEGIKFTLLLRDGHRPRFAVFYDGENDVRAAYESGDVEATMDEAYFQLLLNGSEAAIARTIARQALTKWCQSCDVALKLLRRAFARRLEDSPLGEAEIRDIGDRVVQRYSRTRSVIRRLAESYGVQPVFLWQPVIFTEDGLVGTEQTLSEVVPDMRDVKLAALYRHVSAALPSSPEDNFFNLGRALAERTTGAYVDAVDLSEDGNLVIATRVKEILLPE